MTPVLSLYSFPVLLVHFFSLFVALEVTETAVGGDKFRARFATKSRQFIKLRHQISSAKR